MPQAGGPPFYPFSDLPSTRVRFFRTAIAGRKGWKCNPCARHFWSSRTLLWSSTFVLYHVQLLSPLLRIWRKGVRHDRIRRIPIGAWEKSGVNPGSPKGEPKLLDVRPFAAGPGSLLPPLHQQPAQRSGHPCCWLIRKRKTTKDWPSPHFPICRRRFVILDSCTRKFFISTGGYAVPWVLS
jgi:hypothetical protein